MRKLGTVPRGSEVGVLRLVYIYERSHNRHHVLGCVYDTIKRRIDIYNLQHTKAASHAPAHTSTPWLRGLVDVMSSERD
jgi:hypothetical protein